MCVCVLPLINKRNRGKLFKKYEESIGKPIMSTSRNDDKGEYEKVKDVI